MTVQEMHIGVSQWLQKINAKDTDSFQSSEIDWALSEECLRFIKQRSNPLSNTKHEGFQSTQKRYDDLQELITPAKLSAYYLDDDTVFSFLPQDYFALINDRSLVKNLCSSPLNSVQSIIEYKKITVVNFPIPIETSSPFYIDLRFLINGTNVLFDVNNYITLINGINNITERFYIINLALEVMNKYSPLLEVRWENFDGNYYPNSFIFISKDTSFTGISMQLAGTGGATTVFPFFTSGYKTYVLQSTKQVPNRLTKTEDLYVLLDSSFGTTIVSNPLSSLAKGKINVHHRQKFILSFVNIDYIRKPRKIDLILNRSCELSSNVHEEIVENTARRLSGITKGDNYQQLINENLITE
jgi:hypothetical protein